MDQSDDRIESSRRALTIIGAPLEDGTGVASTVMGPAALRTAGLIRTLRVAPNSGRVDVRPDVRFGPILLQKSGSKGVSAAPWIFEADARPLLSDSPRGAAVLTL